MRGRDLYRILLVIAVITVVSGLGQLAQPDLVLHVVGGEPTPTSRYFFGIIGMFSMLFGSMLLHALLTNGSQLVVILWTGIQKMGLAVAVGLGVAAGLFAPLALGVAGFDLVSGLLAFAYYREVLAAEPAAFPPPYRDRRRSAPVGSH